jgi:hypothetical protein
MSNNGSRPSFASLGERIAKADSHVGILNESKQVDASTLAKIKAMGKGFGKDAAELLSQLDAAESATTKDPFVRYTWIMTELGKLAQLDYVDPAVALRFISLARAKLMPDKKTETVPILVDFPSYGAAMRFGEEQGLQDTQPVAIPFTYRRDARLFTGDLRFVLPNGIALKQAFHDVKKILRTVVTSTADILNSNCFFDLQLAAEWLLRSVPRAQLASRGKLKDKRVFKQTENGAWEFVASKRPILMCDCEVAPGIFLLLPDNGFNRPIIERMKKVAEYNRQLMNNELGMDVTFIRQLRLEDDLPVISPSQFLSGAIGKVAVRHNWEDRESKEKLDVWLMFERRSDGAWRINYYNDAAARTLLRSQFGEELRFTWFSSQEVPGHLARILRHGRIISKPEDLGLTESDLEPSSGSTIEEPSTSAVCS